jgi:H+/Cl- antiporter ClcA
MTLFHNRGWEAIIADDLVGNTLLLTSVVVGLIMGCVGLILNEVTDWFEKADGPDRPIAFALGFIVGLMLTSITLSTVGSAVNAIVVLFAEAPAEFQANHPALSTRMRDAWATVYPGSV